MANMKPQPGQRAFVAFRNLAVMLAVVIIGGWALLAGPAAYDCYRRGFAIIWNPLPSGCLMDASRGLPKPR
jgi:hypothetical protein